MAATAHKPAPSNAPRSAGAARATFTSTPQLTGTRASPIPRRSTTSKGTTAATFLDRAREWFAAHGIRWIERIVTDNGACYRSRVFTEVVLPARHQRITPYTPRHNGKVERYNRILAEQSLYARTWHSEQERADGLALRNLHYNDHRPHGVHDGQPPASRAPASVNNVLALYT